MTKKRATKLANIAVAIGACIVAPLTQTAETELALPQAETYVVLQ